MPIHPQYPIAMVFPTDEAVEKYEDGIAPYIDAYEEAMDATTSVEAQEIMESVKDRQMTVSDLSDKFERGYGQSSGTSSRR